MEIRGLRFTHKAMRLKGGPGDPGSGHHGHAGRPGSVGGSAPGGVSNVPIFAAGEAREARRQAGHYDVITETDEEGAKILLTQGVEPSFKPQIGEQTEYAPGKGLEREGLYVANEESFSKGSFGRVRLYLSTSKDNLKSPQEMRQLGRGDIDDVLGTENGAVTVGQLSKGVFVAVEIRQGNKWVQMKPGDYLESIGVSANTPKLPTVPKYQKWVQSNAERLFLRSDQVARVVHDYNRASLEDKLWMAKEAGLL
jgi:hypothetical protein